MSQKTCVQRNGAMHFARLPAASQIARCPLNRNRDGFVSGRIPPQFGARTGACIARVTDMAQKDTAPVAAAPFGAESIYDLVCAAERGIRALGRLKGRAARRAAARSQLKTMSVAMLDDLGLAGRDIGRIAA